MTNVASALSAYANVAKPDMGSPMEARDVEPGSGFAGALKGIVDTFRQSEQMSASAIAGKADIRDVVAAVNNAEMTLETVVAVRDKVINAYNEIMRMPI